MLIMGEHIKSIIVYFLFSNRSDISVAVDAPRALLNLCLFLLLLFNASSVKHVKRHVLLESPWSILGGVW